MVERPREAWDDFD